MTEILNSINEFFAGLGVISAILGGLVGYIAQLWMSKNKINADLKAKTRLEWIKEVRELTSKIIEQHNDYLKLVYIYNERYHLPNKHSIFPPVEQKKEGIMDEFKEKSIELIASTSENRNLYKLYFARIKKRKWYNPKRYLCCESYIHKHPENEEMHKIVDEVYDQIYNSEKYFIENKSIDPEIKRKNIISEFRNKTSNYLKREWDRAKNNR